MSAHRHTHTHTLTNKKQWLCHSVLMCLCLLHTVICVCLCMLALMCVWVCVCAYCMSICLYARPLPVWDDEVTGPSLLTSQFNLDLHNPGVNFHRVHPPRVSRQVTGVRQPSHVPLLHQQTGENKHAGEEECNKHLMKNSWFVLGVKHTKPGRKTGAVKSIIKLNLCEIRRKTMKLMKTIITKN